MSVLERRASCPGSMRMEEGKPNTTSVYAQRGNFLHAAAAACLDEHLDAAEYLSDDLDGAAIIEPYLDKVRSTGQRMGGQLLIEQGFHLQGIHELYWGTCDACVVAPPRLWVCDLKTGAGHAVPIRRPDGRVNFQLGGYGLGALNSLPPDAANAIDEIELCIVQPPLGPPQSTVMTLAEIQDLAADLVEIAEAATAPDAPLVAGEHCAFCRAAGECPALRASALQAASLEFDVIAPDAPPTLLPNPSHLTLDELAHCLSSAEIVDVWVSAVRAHAKAIADKGTQIPGWKLVNRRGRRQWADEHDASRILGPMAPGGEMFTTELLSPAQAEKTLKRLKLKPPPEWDDLVTVSDPGTALVMQSDPRPAVGPRIAHEFEAIEGEP
jgi:hypothetical protein